MKRRVLRFGAIIGAVTVSALAVAPAFAAAATSQSTAQSLQLSIAGNDAVSQKIAATNNGTSETRNDTSTVPTLADLIKGNNVLGVGVAPQDARANNDGTSFACAGLAGAGGGIAYVGKSSCNLEGKPLTLDLGALDLDLEHLLGNEGAITGPLNKALSGLLLPAGTALDDVVAQIRNGLADSPLGEIKLSGGLSVVEAACTANPDAAKGTAEIADTSGNHKIPITVTLPGGKSLILANVDVDYPAKPGGTNVLLNLKSISDALIDAIKIELQTALDGALAPLNDVVEQLVVPLKKQIVDQLIDALDPLLKAVDENILSLTINNVTPGDNGRSVSVTTLALDVLPAAKQFAGSSLIEGKIGQVSCGPNTRATTTTPSSPVNPAGPHNPASPDVPTVVNSGLAGHEDHTARNVLGATAALMLLAGTAGLVGYRRMLNK